MKTVGQRRELSLQALPSGKLLAEGAAFSEAVARLAPVGLVPKGVYRFKTHEEANAFDQDCIVQAMVRLAQARQ